MTSVAQTGAGASENNPSLLPEWPVVHEVQASGLLRQKPEDFQVSEIPVCLPDGSGEHVWLHIRKRLLETDQVAAKIAALCGVSRGDVSYAGLKDKVAVTEQWFSVRLPKADPNWSELEADGLEILGSQRHGRKLRTGALRGNRFVLVLRDVQGDQPLIEQALQRIRSDGVPNYFGPQRFGRHGRNIEAARRFLSASKARVSRFKRGIYLSTARSFLFNELLARRVVDHSWNQAIPGDLLQLNGSNSIFPVKEIDEEVLSRIQTMDVHPTGPLWGTVRDGQYLVTAYEADALSGYTEFTEGLVRKKVKAARRALRMQVGELAWDWRGKDLELHFELEAGCYATSVLREIVK